MLHELEPESTAYNEPSAYRIRGPLDLGALEKSVSEVVRRHETLRTTFALRDEQPIQVIAPPSELRLELIDMTGLAGAQQEAALDAHLTQAAGGLFSLAKGPLYRTWVVKLSDQDHVLVFMAHHTVTDGWSLSVFLRELVAHYQNFSVPGRAPLPPLPIQYADFAAWQREWLKKGELDRQAKYWQGVLRGELPTLNLPTDRPRPMIRSHRGSNAHIDVPKDVVAQLVAVGREESATLFMVLFAAWNTLLHRYTQQDDIIVGTAIANRQLPETESLIGYFANTVAVRSNLAGAPAFRVLLGQVRDSLFGAFDHQDMPFQRLMELVQPERDLGRTPIYQTLFSFMDAGLNRDVEAAGLTWTRVHVKTDYARTDLGFFLEENAAGLHGALEYSSDLFDAETISRLLEGFTALLRDIGSHPNKSIAELDVIGPGQKQTLAAWNQTEGQHPPSRCVHQLFEAQVDRTPEAIALAHADELLSYRELNARANRLARHLVNLGVGPDVLVGVCMERGSDLIIALLAVLKAGGAYVPLDPGFPKDRLAYMLADAATPVVLTQERCHHLVSDAAATIVRVEGAAAEISLHSPANLDAAVASHHLAYVIYTSGSTGKPKGVMVEHGNVANFFQGIDTLVDHQRPGVWLAVTSISFDISVLELFWTLARGFKVVLHDSDQRKARRAPAARRTAAGRSSRDQAMAFSLFYFASDEGKQGANKYHLLLEGAKFADANGFSAVWTPERHFHAFGGLYPNPAITGAAIAVTTKRVKIRAGSVVLPLANPVRVAEDWALVDNLSNGRVAISFAPGWQPEDFALAPENYRDRREIMYRGIETIRGLWRGETRSFTAGDGKSVTLATLPRPIQPELPFFLTSSGTIETCKQAGAMGAHLLTHLLGQSVEELGQKLAAYRQAWREAGHPGQPYVALMLHSFIGTDLASTRDIVREPFKQYLRGSISLFLPFAKALGLDASALSAEDTEALVEHAFDRYYASSGLFGTVASSVAMVERLEQLGVDEIACLIDFGIETAVVLEGLQRLNELRVRVQARTPRVETSASDETGPGTGTGEQTSEADHGVPALIKRHGVTHLQCTPSMAAMMLADPESRDALAGLSHWLVGGEALPPQLANDLTELLEDGRVTNMYGPTETTVWSAAHEVDNQDGPVPIGRPLPNQRIYVLDGRLEPVPIGVEGELVIGGQGVVRGYRNLAPLTHERFVADRQSPEPGARMYRTGDLGRFRADGVLEFIGRNDFQVKLRGYRIELGEIEAVLAQAASVSEVVVILREDTPGDKRLVAYVVARRGAQVDLEELRAKVRAELTDFMVPSAFVVIPAMPLTPNAKIDRNALPPPETTAMVPTVAFAAPASAIEELIAGIWQKVLRLPRVGRQDNFFDLGGHSLLIIHVLNQLRAAGQSLKTTDLFRFPTIASLAKFLSGSDAAAAATKAEESGKNRAETRRELMNRRRSR